MAGPIITIAQHTGSDALSGTAQSPTITYASAQTAGNLNALLVQWDNSQPIVSVLDTTGNIYNLHGIFSTATTAFAFFRCLSIKAAAGGNVVTMTFAAAPTAAAQAWIIEANASVGVWVDGPTDGASGNGTQMTSSGSTLTSQPALGFAAGTSGNGSTVSAGTGWTQLDALSGSDADQWQSVGSTGLIQATASQSVSGNWDIGAAYFFINVSLRAKLLPLGI